MDSVSKDETSKDGGFFTFVVVSSVSKPAVDGVRRSSGHKGWYSPVRASKMVVVVTQSQCDLTQVVADRSYNLGVRGAIFTIQPGAKYH